MSRIRRIYMVRLAARVVALAGCAWLYAFRRAEFALLDGWNFFRRISVLHLFWIAWMADMIPQLAPVGRDVALGSQKLFRNRFRPAAVLPGKDAIRGYIRSVAGPTAGIAVMWAGLLAGIVAARVLGLLDAAGAFLISAVFYVCDLVCVLIWCPFRLMLGNRCCTTCRIFNWDHIMMLSPLALAPGFFGWSLVLAAGAVLIVWEAGVARHPERFWYGSNEALRCSACTDKLCTQYCGRKDRQ